MSSVADDFPDDLVQLVEGTEPGQPGPAPDQEAGDDEVVKLIEVDQTQLARHVDGLVRSAVEETLNALLDAEADQLCGAQRYQRSPDRTDYRAGSYTRKLHTKAGEVELKVPKLRRATFESQVIERYRRRETSVEEALVEMYLAGVSVRRVEDITEALWGTRVRYVAGTKWGTRRYLSMDKLRVAEGEVGLGTVA